MKKAIQSIVVLGLLIGMFGITSFASNDNIGFNFKILANGLPSHSSGSRYRQTTHCDNQWKVQMTISGEGEGTVTIFSLGRVDTDKSASPMVFATQGLGPYYQSANPAANQTNVNLRGKNNNYNAKTYQVYGIWDEETW